MPVRAPRTPSYRLHKPTGQGVTTLGGRDIYLGKHGTPESHVEYDRVIVEWIARGRPGAVADRAGSPPADLTVAELLASYMKYAEGYYRKGDRLSPEVENIKLAIKPLRRLHGHTPASGFGPVALKAVRQLMIASGLCRNQVNQRIGRIVRVFKWAVSEELVSPTVHQGLKSVAGLRKGRSEARESPPVEPVADALVDAIQPHVSRQVWAMVQLQRLTGMRPGEACLMRTCDIDATGRVWIYSPHDHKTSHRGKDRRIPLGPQAQEIVTPWLKDDATAYLFSPSEAVAERRAGQRKSRKSNVQPSQEDRSTSRPRRAARDRYDARTYHHAIQYGCANAKIEPWHPHQLRHSAATRLRRDFGLDVARVILGHASPATTEIYAEMDQAKAIDIMGQVG